MRIFVTGGTGFIGSHFVKLALSSGHEVSALRRPGSKPRIQLPQEPEWIEGSLNDVDSSDFENCAVVVHFAAQGVSPQPTDWDRAFQVNVSQSIKFASTAASAQIPHFVACGSCFEYGKSSERLLVIPPNTPLEPVGPYAASKAAFSHALEAMSRTSSSSFTILRPFHIYGEGQHESNLWPSLRRAALQGLDFPMSRGEQIRDYMPVEEAAAIFLAHATCPTSQSLLVSNIGSGNPTTIREFAIGWWKFWKASGDLKIGEIPYQDNEIMRFVPLI